MERSMNSTDLIARSPRAGQDRPGLLVALSAGAAMPFFAGCAVPGPGPAPGSGEALEEPGFAEPSPGTQRRVALVLSGGGARGFAHLGMLRVLEREGWKPDLVVGTSADAIVRAM